MNGKNKAKNLFFLLLLSFSGLILIYVSSRFLIDAVFDFDIRWQIRYSLSITFVILFVILWGSLKIEKNRKKAGLVEPSESDEYAAFPIIMAGLYGFAGSFVMAFVVFQALNAIAGNPYFIIRDIIGFSFIISANCFLFTNIVVRRMKS